MVSILILGDKEGTEIGINATTRQEMATAHQSKEETREGSSLKPQREQVTETLILHFWPPKLGDNTFMTF